MPPSSFPMPRNISFRVETFYAGKGRLGRIRPDENGIYKGLPVMVLGEVTQQQTYYDPTSMMNQIVNPDTRFNKVMTQGKLYGEYGHPQFFNMNDQDKMVRLLTVDEKQSSHLFTSVYTDNPSPDGSVVVRADIRPTGPFGHIAKESLEDPVVNTAFSLRAFVDNRMTPNGVKFRTVRQLVTWDIVGASGYATTDKAHAIGLESFSGDEYLDYEIVVQENGNLKIDQIALETFSDTDLNEIFGTSKISKISQTITLVETDKSLSERFPSLYRKGIFNEHFREF